MSSRLQVLYEDNHLLVISKPPGIATQGVSDEPSVHQQAQQYLKRKYDKPGNVYVGIVSRIDKRVSGVLVLARTSKAAARLTEQFKQSTVKKRYVALVEGELIPPDGTLQNWLSKSEAKQRMIAWAEKREGAVEARLRYQTKKQVADTTAVEIDLLTGRKHQIRVQFADLGFPILGDDKYGASRRPRTCPFSRSDQIALHAWSLEIEHPVKKRPMRFLASIPASWSQVPAGASLAAAIATESPSG